MSQTLADKIKKTQNSFPSQQTASVVECPFKHAEKNDSPTSPVEIEKGFHMTQAMAQSMGISQAQQKAKEKKAWIEIVLVDMDGKPVPNVRYKITPSGGDPPQEGRLNEHGQAGYYQIEPGDCKITFPDLDKDAWE